MAILAFDPSHYPLPDWSNLSLRDPSEPRINELETLLTSDQKTTLKTLRAAADALSTKKREEVLRAGHASSETIEATNAADDAYYNALQTFFDQHPTLSETVSRKSFDISPPPPPEGKRSMNNPFPVYSAPMDMLWPGFYPDHYDFLKGHKANYHFPETIGSLGGVFISPPNVSADRNRKLLNHMGTAHPQWRTAPQVTLETTRRSLLKILSHYEADYVAAVMDKGGQLIGTVGRKEAEGRKAEHTVDRFYTRLNRVPVRDVSLTAGEGFKHMQEEGLDYLMAMRPDNTPLIMPKSVAALGNLLKPFRHGTGLGAMITVGVSKNSDPLGYLRELIKDTDYDLESGNTPFAGVLIDTALCARRDVYNIIAQIREALPNTYLQAGTVTTAKATKELLRYVDSVKVGIAEGGHCKTANTGVRIPNAWATIECGAEAEGKGLIISDGLHDETECTLGMSMKNVAGKMGGGALLTRVESAMPIEINDDKKECKKGRGMAASSTEEDRRRERTLTEYEQWEEVVGIHGEGEDGRLNPLREPRTLGKFFWRLAAHLKSAGRYADANNLREFQERSRLYYIGGKNGH